MQTYIGFDSALPQQAALFKVGTNRGDVFMTVNRTDRKDEDRAIVEVRGDALLGLWRNWATSQTEGASPLRASSRWLGEELEFADDDLMLGQTELVPLAEVRCGVRPQPTARRINESSFIGTTTQPYVTVTDGAARMLWLGSIGARCFPVECLVAEAPLLSRLAGTPRSHWLRVSELLQR
ncbi:hypothetical protein EVC45_39380 [Paraburkholderia sp. UYCP14C]|uniref:plasmid fertility inhibition factor family protein n=1 Tax=Paraburkholderia sp. UYCP14C TaxID=2511130 RepID=UPI00102211A6|nr:hypothetical protein [Paraburkholderia sp. UYCP14C]RZF24326.1 hypothetical protein EVC45_39380 [Paraburkholderia sp. UYCP14C]